MAWWNRAVVSDQKFTAVWRYHDGSTIPVAKHLHMADKTVRERARALGLVRTEYLTSNQAAQRLGVSHTAVLSWCRKGFIAAVQHRGKGSYWRITPHALEEFRARMTQLPVWPYVIEPEHLTTGQAAKMLGYTRDGIRKACVAGAIRAHKAQPHGDWRISEQEVARLKDGISAHGRMLKADVPAEPEEPEEPALPTEALALLRHFLERDGRQVSQIAGAAQIDQSFLGRLLRGERGGAKRGTVEALAGALHLSDVEQGKLLVAFGFIPRALIVLGWDRSLDSVAETLATLTNGEAAAYRREVLEVARKWRAAR